MKASSYASATGIRVAALILNAMGMIFLFPFILHNIGEHDFGIWSMAASITEYMLMIDFGVSLACTRFLSITTDNKQWQKIVTNAVTLSLLVMVLLLMFGFGILSFRFFDINIISNRSLALVIGILAIEAGISMVLRVYQSVLRTELKYFQLGLFEVLRVILRLIGFPLILYFGGGLVELVIYSSIVNVGLFLSSFLYVRFVHQQIFFNKNYIDFTIIKDLFNFGKYAVFVQIAELFRYRLDGVFIGIALGISSIAQYAIMITIIDMSVQISSRFLSYWETIIIRYTGEDKKASIDYMFKSMAIGFWIAAFFIGNIYLFGEMFITLWVGKQYAHLADELTLFSTILILVAFQMSITPYLNGHGKQKNDALFALVEVIGKAIIAVPIIQYYGFKGIILTTIIIGLMVSLFGRMYIVSKLSQTSYWSLISRLVKTIIPILALLIILYGTLMAIVNIEYPAILIVSKVVMVLLQLLIAVVLFLVYSKRSRV